MTVSEVEGHDLLMNLLLPVHCLRLPPILSQASMNKTGVVVVEPGKITTLYLHYSFLGLIIMLSRTHVWDKCYKITIAHV